ncbi:Glutathione transferase 3 [Wickerhamomyces ciferrii]|uniref:Glutathione transferase 3 n=1 Tax=Wickerhamomyces ciferrii (strain ATCC 14091 / BCRC 22168 / CBS 111 / JCM 3599 / NBRC 0793 / NRRL Y-1031 F-60-10) TaxID=1206466 RepID=K0KYV5_WICCF|nr:Glutathione transferase 3 [Wickerhamomyces ciferrii]CCH46584.1 Glutathione transferase 3 [Wickerhamomyces ciferrii]
MSLKQQTKASLVEMCRDLNVNEEGTKPILEEKLAQHFDNHPELENHQYYRKFYIFRQKNSPTKEASTNVYKNDITSSPSYKVIPQLNDGLRSSPDKVLNIRRNLKNKSSPYKSAVEDEASELVEDEEQDDDDEEEKDDEKEDDEEEDDDVELLNEDGTPANEDDEEADGEYKPKFEFLTKIQDWFIETYESTYDYLEDQKEEFIYSTVKFNNDTRKKLSSVQAVNFFIQSLELGLLTYQQVPLIQISEAPFLSQEIISKYKFIDQSWKIFDLSALIQFKFILIVLTWFTFSIGIPLFVSHYVNFTTKKFKKQRFDPLIFNIVKLIISYLVYSKTISFQDIKDDTAVWADEHGLLQATLYEKINAHFVHNSITLNLVLGNIPFIGSSVGILVALYVASLA